MNRPRILLAGLSGGAGKTTLTLGICRALARMGRKIKPFKKGPDYIDAAWLGLAAKNTASNLDPFLMPEDIQRALFWDKVQDAELGLIEGNRGLFDGKDLAGSCSSSELARQLRAPVILVMDCTKMTRTAAALVAGVKDFEPGVNLAGVILNRTAGERHRKILRQCIEHYAQVPVVGALPKLDPNPIPERHMGLISNHEYDGAESVLEKLADVADEFVDLKAIWEAAVAAPPPKANTVTSRALWPEKVSLLESSPVRIGYVRDAALWFYYDENLEALRRAGAELVEVSLLSTKKWPEIDGLYLGGGFPESMAQQLAENTITRQRVRSLAEMGVPVFAECGGFMYLSQNLVVDGQKYPMSGVFPVSVELFKKPQGLGYVEATVEHQNPFFSQGTTILGHEFHYSRCIASDGSVLTLSLKMQRGEGLLAGYDGLIYKNTFAAYTHTHALGVPEWAPNFVSAAKRYRNGL